MAHVLLDSNDTNPCSNHYTARWPKDCQDDRQNLLASDPTYWLLFQLEFDLRKQDISLFECCIHPDAEGTGQIIANPTAITDNSQATTPVAVLLASWALGVAPPSLKTLGNVSFIVIGVIIASFGEIQFDLTGFLYQLGGITFEALRLVLVQKLLSSAEFKMDPLVSLYYFAPVCALMNGVVALIMEVPSMTMDNVYQVGFLTLLANAMVAFLLNVSVVFLIGKTSSLVLTLCGVLKDILLVGLSMLIWGTPVTALQFFGYGIALAGMMYYKLGAEQLKGYFNQAGMRWAEFGVQRPAMRKIVVFGLVLLTFFLLLGGLAPTFAPEQTQDFKKLLGGATLGTK